MQDEGTYAILNTISSKNDLHWVLQELAWLAVIFFNPSILIVRVSLMVDTFAVFTL